ncbi:hypothetical protein B0H16DRAFT_1702015 [Mycena metata]|uniref:Uncharacterized protein n=1 Tax=Mycena metata TaxID=1033252 RepID=A0AAD7MF00_9AGAR|nr:hypothetical protein B0H16DRAFT_1702015 [Mycena metata]
MPTHRFAFPHHIAQWHRDSHVLKNYDPARAEVCGREPLRTVVSQIVLKFVVFRFGGIRGGRRIGARRNKPNVMQEYLPWKATTPLSTARGDAADDTAWSKYLPAGRVAGESRHATNTNASTTPARGACSARPLRPRCPIRRLLGASESTAHDIRPTTPASTHHPLLTVLYQCTYQSTMRAAAAAGEHPAGKRGRMWNAAYPDGAAHSGENEGYSGGGGFRCMRACGHATARESRSKLQAWANCVFLSLETQWRRTINPTYAVMLPRKVRRCARMLWYPVFPHAHTGPGGARARHKERRCIEGMEGALRIPRTRAELEDVEPQLRRSAQIWSWIRLAGEVKRATEGSGRPTRAQFSRCLHVQRAEQEKRDGWSIVMACRATTGGSHVGTELEVGNR